MNENRALRYLGLAPQAAGRDPLLDRAIAMLLERLPAVPGRIAKEPL